MPTRQEGSGSTDNYWSRLGSRRASRRQTLAAASSLGFAGAAAAFSGCGDDSSSKQTPTRAASNPTSPSGQTATQAATQAATAVALDANKMSEKDFIAAIPLNLPKTWADKDIRRGGRIVRIFNQSPTFDSITTTISGPTSEVSLPVYNRLIRGLNSADLKDYGSGQLEGDIATSWERPDIETIVLTLAPNVKFQNVAPLNGRAMTTDDIRYAFERGRSYAKSVFKNQFSTFGKIEDVGSGKISVKLATPHPSAEQLLASYYASIVPKEIGDDPTTAATKAVGTGPMILRNYTPNVGYEYEKNPDYFKTGRPYIDGYSLKVIADPAGRSALFETGQADFYYGATSVINLDNVYNFAKKRPEVVLQLGKRVAGTQVFGGHYDRPPWNDVRVRRALSMLMDRRTMADTLYKGVGTFEPFFPCTLR